MRVASLLHELQDLPWPSKSDSCATTLGTLVVGFISGLLLKNVGVDFAFCRC